MPDPTPPTPRAVTPPLEWARRNVLGCMSCQHGPDAEPGKECEACRRVVADFESEARADERAALAASAGPLTAELLQGYQRVIDGAKEETVGPILVYFQKLLTAYTALAAECVALRATVAELEQERDSLRNLLNPPSQSGSYPPRTPTPEGR